MNITIDIGPTLAGLIFVGFILWFIFRSDK